MEFESLKEIKVSDSLFRYIVPFSYDDKTKEDSYTYAIRKLKEANWILEKRSSKESECFEYLRTIYTMEEDVKENNTVVGSIWKIPYNNKERVSIVYQQEVVEDNKKHQKTVLEAQIVDAGIYLLKNKIGLFWYEIDIKNRDITLDLLVEFQNRFKELANRDDAILIKLSGEFLVEKNDIFPSNGDIPNCYDVSLISKENKKVKENNTQQAYKIENKTIVNGISLLKDQKEIKTANLKAIEIKKNDKKLYNLKYDITLNTSKWGVWISRKLAEMNCEISFYPNRSEQLEKTIPDKALLFNYIAIQEGLQKEQELKYAAYYLTKGYKKSYKPNSSFQTEMVYPFENIIWNAQKEGCGIYVSFSDDNKGFMSGGMKDRVSRDYFHLYMSLLQQSYTLLRFSEEIATSIPTDKDEYRYYGARIEKKLEDLQLRINIFLMKNVYSSVGFSGQHNQFYTYIEKTLNIKEDISALNSGMEVLEELLRRKELERRDTALMLISLLSLLAFPHTMAEVIGIPIDNILGFSDVTINYILYGLYFVTILLFVFVLPNFLRSLKKNFFSKPYKSKYKKNK